MATRKKEGDKNIFDILIGVSIIFFIKYKKPLKNKIVKFYSTIENNLISSKPITSSLKLLIFLTDIIVELSVEKTAFA